MVLTASDSSFAIFATFAAILHSCSGQAVSLRNDKLLNVFNIVKFPNDGCTTSAGTYGVCYTASECDTLGGSGSGTCASGFGVCCLFSGTCGGSTATNNTYFKSTGSDSSVCTFKVCKSGSDICQLRLGFDTFVASQPSTVQPGDTSANGRTQCQKAQFVATSDGPAAPTLCGTITGQHMIVEARDDCNELSFSWSSASSQPEWNIHVLQIPCSAWWKPQDGCSQWFTGTSGYVKSFNYDQGIHLANQQYTACVRQEMGYCTIAWSSVSTTSFQISGPAASLTGVTGDDCSQDYVLVYSAAASPTAVGTNRWDKMCGAYWGVAGTSTITVYSTKLPFQLLVNFDGTEVEPATPTTENSLGFYLYYKQTAC